jgi:hypothetical protein
MRQFVAASAVPPAATSGTVHWITSFQAGKASWL